MSRIGSVAMLAGTFSALAPAALAAQAHLRGVRSYTGGRATDGAVI